MTQPLTAPFVVQFLMSLSPGKPLAISDPPQTRVDPDPAVTRLIQAVANGESDARSKLMDAVYGHLRAIAAQRMAQERADHTLQPTALVHEVYRRLIGNPEVQWNGRAHFFRSAADAMRKILIDHARARRTVKRGGGQPIARLSSVSDLAETADPEAILAVDDAIERFEKEDAQAAEIVRLRFYAGLDYDAIAGILGISQRSVRREWTFARAWLRRRLEQCDR